MIGPGLLAGLSDDDPAGITTYSILGTEYGYQLLWVLTLSTFALVVFHEVAVRLGIASGKGLMTLIREHYGPKRAALVLSALVIANTGTLCAEFAGVAAASELLGGVSKYVTVPLAALLVSGLVLRGTFKYVEHVLMVLSTVLVAYVIAGIMAGPDWGEATRGLVVPSMPATSDAVLVAVATVGTTLAPWGLSFIQSYAVDKKIKPEDFRYERVDVVVGAVLTGVIGFFVVVACAATLHQQEVSIEDARDAAKALEPLAGNTAATLFGLGFLGAALLAAAIVPLSTAYSISETTGHKADINDDFQEARVFYVSYAVIVAIAAAVVLIPGAPLVPILFLSQALNAVLLLVLLPFIRALGKNRDLMGDLALGRAGRAVTGITFVGIAASVLALFALTVL